MDNLVMIKAMSPDLEKRVQRNPLLNIDTFIIPSPYIKEKELTKDRNHSYVWIEEGEILGYMLVYSNPSQDQFLIYKQVTSPFGRGRGIGSTFIEFLSANIPDQAVIYLYIWEKQTDTVDFFTNKGFTSKETIVYRNLVYHYLEAEKNNIIRMRNRKNKKRSSEEDIGKTRHDARKTLRLMSNMVEMLSAENGERIIEDINRETTTLINMLNSFRDTMQITHKVNLKELILDRIVSYIEGSSQSCELRLNLMPKRAIVRGYYVSIGRALINLVSNALDAIRESKREGIISIDLFLREDNVVLRFQDNGTGIPADKLLKDEDNIPLFVGKTTKREEKGEGLGTRQIYSTFGSENIRVSSVEGEGTCWEIDFIRITHTYDKKIIQLERRYNEFSALWEETDLTETVKRNEVISYIWQLRKLEIFLFDLILQYSQYNNIRTIYRTILSYIQGTLREEGLKEQIDQYQADFKRLNTWLFEVSREIKHRYIEIDRNLDVENFRGALFKSYGQAYENVIIFTLDPETGNFLATDRKLAEHLDFVPFLGKKKDDLLRGEFIGDMNNDEKPISFGVWSIESDEDLLKKLKLMRQGANKLIEIGIHRKKKLAFYQTTYIRHNYDIDTYASTTFSEFARLDDEGLKRFIRPVDDELKDFMMLID